ncbi:MAG: glutathione S-transferase family protein [bacterium]|nr:glutathione S-transferase family protein [bacterium]
MPKVHGVNLSPFVRKLRVALAEKNISYELLPVVPFGLPPEFLAISPAAKIPVFEEDDGYTLPDSSAIIGYLEKTRPAAPLFPEDAKLYGQTLFYEEYGDTEVASAVLPFFRERYVNVKMMGKEADEARLKTLTEEAVPRVFDHLESVVGDGDGIVANRFTAADASIGSMFVSYAHGGETIDAARWPKLAAYVQRLHARPSFKALIEEENQA